MARHSRSRSRSRSPHNKRRKHLHHSSHRSHDRSKERPRERSRDRREHRYKEEKDHKRPRHSLKFKSDRDEIREKKISSGDNGTGDSRHRGNTPESGKAIQDSQKAAKNNPESRTSTGNGVLDSRQSSDLQKNNTSTSNPSIAALLDQEEKIRQRRERVEQWRREREAAKKAEDEAKSKDKLEVGESPYIANEAMDLEGKGKSWSLEDDDEDETMEVDGAPDAIDLPPPAPKPDDDVSQVTPVRRNPLLGFGARKSASSKAKPKVSLGEDDERNAVDPRFRKQGLPKASPAVSQGDISRDQNEAEGEEDPLDAYMKGVEVEVKELDREDKRITYHAEKSRIKDQEAEQEEEEEEEEEIASDPEDILALAAKKLKKKDLAAVDHSLVKYEPFRKDFYIEPPEMRDMSADDVDVMRLEMDEIKIRGVDCPKPIRKWTHAGLPAACLQIIKKLNFEKPTPIQSQAIPAIMAGRDVIGVAKTGSGKTIAFLLPMFRHIKDQRPLEPMEGPIAVIMTPTRELAVQIHRECKPFLKVLNLRAVCAYGGSPIKDQIADLKRGAEIIVCTPGRMIDLLCANSGRVANLKRVTYLVLDEADRMFDMGFEPQVMKIVNNVRPDRQTVLFSATFPRQMEALARKVLKRPLEITVGGRSVVAQDVSQVVEVREDDSKFVRLLEILGQQYNDDPDARALIFVDRQEAADNLLKDLMRKGYPCMSLHGGKDQLDRDSTIADFKSGVCQLLIATSVAARGLDVKQLKLVINFECPNHMEDYVHRVGRTGRAGNKGTAYTFITPEQDRYAMDIVKALKLSGGHVSPELQALADGFQEKVKAGSASYSSSGFGGKGLERLDKERDLVKKVQRKTYGDVDDEATDEEEMIDVKTTQPNKKEEAANNSAGTSATATTTNGAVAGMNPAALKAAQERAARINNSLSTISTTGVQRAIDIIADINTRFKENAVQGVSLEDKKAEVAAEYSVEIEINDYPQKARWKVTNKEQISQITELTGAAITTRGTYFPPGRNPGIGERKLFLFVEGENEYVVEKAKNEIKRILTETTLSAIEAEARNPGSSSLGGYGKYSVV